MAVTFTAAECKVLKDQVVALVRKGYHPHAARRLVCEAACRIKKQKGTGMGQPVVDPMIRTEDTGNLFQKAAAIEPIKQLRETISPWLWVTSLVGFGMAILNTRRIAQMYGKWKKGRRKAMTA